MGKLLRLSKASENELHFAKRTFYKWHHLQRYPELFVTMGRTVFIDMEALDGILEGGRQKCKTAIAKAEARKAGKESR